MSRYDGYDTTRLGMYHRAQVGETPAAPRGRCSSQRPAGKSTVALSLTKRSPRIYSQPSVATATINKLASTKTPPLVHSFVPLETNDHDKQQPPANLTPKLLLSTFGPILWTPTSTSIRHNAELAHRWFGPGGRCAASICQRS